MYPRLPALEDLEALLAVSRAGSISLAARERGVHQQTMSTRISRAEKALGVTVFARSPYGVTATERGATVLQALPDLLAAARNFTATVSSLLADDTPRHLTIAASNTVAEVHYPHWAARYHQLHPAARMTMLQANSRAVRAMVADSVVDLGIVEGGSPRHDLRETVIGADELVIAVPSGHPWSARGQVSNDELRSTALVVREPGSGSRRVIEDALGHLAEPAGEFGSLSAQRAGMLALEAPAIISKGAVADQVALGRIRVVGSETPFNRNISVVTRAGRNDNPDVAAFIAVAREEGL
nr:LysR family transcriptional regulator [Corynebacterium lactis]